YRGRQWAQSGWPARRRRCRLRCPGRCRRSAGRLRECREFPVSWLRRITAEQVPRALELVRRHLTERKTARKRVEWGLDSGRGSLYEPMAWECADRPDDEEEQARA